MRKHDLAELIEHQRLGHRPGAEQLGRLPMREGEDRVAQVVLGDIASGGGGRVEAEREDAVCPKPRQGISQRRPHREGGFAEQTGGGQYQDHLGAPHGPGVRNDQGIPRPDGAD